MKQEDLFDIRAARIARDIGIAQVTMTSTEWADDFRTRLWALAPGFTGTAEEIRLHVKMPPPPGSPNAIGAAIMGAAKRGWLEWTGEMRQPTNKKSHARRTQVWRRR